MDIPPEYRNRPFLQPGANRKSLRDVDRFPDHIPGTFTVATPPPPLPTISADAFTSALHKVLAHHATKQAWPNTPHILPANQNRLNHIIANVTDLSAAKGIYIFGTFGSGKTAIATAIACTSNLGATRYSNLRRYHMHSYDKLFDQTRIEGTPEPLYTLTDKNIYLDDILYQDRHIAQIFGNKDNIADIIITRMYASFKCGRRHIITSNHAPADLLKQNFIHPGSYDRLIEMFHLYSWEGNSLRK